jgi:hypothetical protein
MQTYTTTTIEEKTKEIVKLKELFFNEGWKAGYQQAKKDIFNKIKQEI